MTALQARAYGGGLSTTRASNGGMRMLVRHTGVRKHVDFSVRVVYVYLCLDLCK